MYLKIFIDIKLFWIKFVVYSKMNIKFDFFKYKSSILICLYYSLLDKTYEIILTFNFCSSKQKNRSEFFLKTRLLLRIILQTRLLLRIFVRIKLWLSIFFPMRFCFSIYVMNDFFITSGFHLQLLPIRNEYLVLFIFILIIFKIKWT